MIEKVINKGTGANNKTGDTAQAIWTLINELIVDHNTRNSTTVNLLRFIPPSEWPAIQARTSTYDCHSALMAAFNHDLHGSAWYPMASAVVAPPGLYNCSQTVAPKRRFSLIGNTTGLESEVSSEFKFPAGVTGFVIDRYNTANGGVEQTPTGGCDGSLISGITITGGGYQVGPTVAHGVVQRARAKLVGVSVRQFYGDGFRVVASAGLGIPESEGNANLFRMEMCSATWIRDNGLYVDGADANAGSVVGFNAVYCGRWGIWDSSFLGNGYEHCHTASNGLRGLVHHNGSRWYLIDDNLGGSTEPGTNSSVWVFHSTGGVHFIFPQWVSGNSYITGGPYKSDNNNAVNTFVSCYSEGDQPPSFLLKPAMVIGGLHGAGFRSGGGAMIIGYNLISPFAMRDAGAVFETRFGYNGNEAVAAVANGDHPNGLALAAWDSTSGDWVTQHAKLGARIAARYTTNLSTFTGGRSAAVGGGHIRFPRGAFLGQRMVDSGTAPPSSGEAARGDMRINENAAVGQPSYWQCTTAGTNGSSAVWTPGPLL